MNNEKAQKKLEQLQEHQAKKDRKDVVKQGNDIGIMLKNLDEAEHDETNALLKPKSGKYRIDQKHFALMFLEVFQKEDPYDGEYKPRYQNVSNMLGINRRTLVNWWAARDEINAQKSTIMNRGMDYIASNFMVELIRMTQAMSNIDYDAMLEGGSADQKNFISLLNTLVNKMRLLTNQSTNNVAHDHKVQMVVPDD